MKIKKDPYSYICNYFESRYPHAGEKVFQYASLVVASASLPEFELPTEGKNMLPTLHLIIVGNSGSGKSALLKEAKSLAFDAELIGKITEAQLEYKIGGKKRGTLMINDLKRNLETRGFEKVFEGIVDGFVSRETTETQMKGTVKISSISAGVMSDLQSKKLFTGFLPRLIPIFLIYDVNKQKEVVDKIAEQYVKEVNEALDMQTIKDYYELLTNIQGDRNEHERIEKAKFPEKGKNKLKKRWKLKIDEIGSNKKYYYRDFEYGYRLALNHAFLNYFNRTVENNTIAVTMEDFKIAMDLMEKEIGKKDKLMSNPTARKNMTEMPNVE